MEPTKPPGDPVAAARCPPIELLKGMFDRVAAIEPPIDNPPGNEWHMAIGALLAFGTVDALTDAETRNWEAIAQAHARRLGAVPDDSDRQPASP